MPSTDKAAEMAPVAAKAASTKASKQTATAPSAAAPAAAAAAAAAPATADEPAESAEEREREELRKQIAERLHEIAPQLEASSHQKQMAELLQKFGTPPPPDQRPKDAPAPARPTSGEPLAWLQVAEGVDKALKDAKGVPATSVAAATSPGEMSFVPIGTHTWEQVRLMRAAADASGDMSGRQGSRAAGGGGVECTGVRGQPCAHA